VGKGIRICDSDIARVQDLARKLITMNFALVAQHLQVSCRGAVLKAQKATSERWCDSAACDGRVPQVKSQRGCARQDGENL
jgi:hypothetical protein